MYISQSYSGGGGGLGEGGGGGGGAAGAGGAGSSGTYITIKTWISGEGGDGVMSNISGADVTYAKGGLGGGGLVGDSAIANNGLRAGDPNTGNGGSGGWSNTSYVDGFSGGSGIVIVRWRWNP